MSQEFAQGAFGRLMSIAQLVDAITSAVHSLSASDVHDDDNGTISVRPLPSITPLISLQDVPSEQLTPELADVMLEALCNTLESEVLSGVNAAREEMHSLRQRLTATRDSERAALLAADALQEERDEGRKNTDALHRQVEELTRTKQQLMDEVADLRLDAGSKVADSAQVAALEQQLQQMQRQNELLRQAHRGRNVGEVKMQEMLQEQEITIQEQQALLKIQQQQLDHEQHVTQQHQLQLRMLQRRLRAQPHWTRGRKFHRIQPARVKRSYALEPIAISRRRSGELQRRESLLVRNLKEDLMDAERREQIRAEIVALECENDLLRRDVARLQLDLEDVAAGQGKVTGMTAELRAKTLQLTQARTQAAELEAKLAAKELQLSELKARVEELHNQLGAFRTENEELRAEITGKYSADQKLNSERKLWEATEQELKARLEAALAAREEGKVPSAAVVAAATEAAAPTPAESAESPHRVDKTDYEQQLEALKLKMRQRTREIQRTCKEEMVMRAQSFSTRLMEYEAEIAQLEQRNRNMELKLEKLAEGGVKAGETERRAAAGLEKLLKPLPSGEFAVTLPGATTSVKVPIQRFIQHRHIIIHVSLPPQKLIIFNRGGNYRIDKAADAAVMQPPALIDLEESK